MSGLSFRAVAQNVVALGLACTIACTGRGADATKAESVVARPTFGSLGAPVGVALVDYRMRGPHRWCASFEDRTLAIGDTVTLVWPDSGADPVTVAVTEVRATRAGRCPRLPSDTADAEDPDLGTVYLLALPGAPDTPDSSAVLTDWVTSPGIAIGGNVAWTRGAAGFARADLDGDENPEQARLCTSQEGAWLSLWTVLDSANGGGPPEHRRWRTYQSLGYDVEPSCTEMETDDDPPEPETPTS